MHVMSTWFCSQNRVQQHHLLKDHLEKGDIELGYIKIERQLTDIFTKPLDATHFASLREKLGVYHPYDIV
jgi:hypothetical protein